MKYECTCGKKSKNVKKNANNVGDMKKQSGFKPILSSTGGITWICPDCYKKVEDLAKQIYDIIPDRHLYFAGFIHKYAKEKEGE